ncbi:MAG: Cna B-type domain-containing protein [Negativibacillus sp.]
MKKTLKQISVLLLALVMVLSMAVPALAADGTSRVTYKDGFEFTVDDGTQMTDTDLFSSFKDVMPGDTLEQEITIINSCTSCDYVKVYLQAIPHDAENKPVAEGLENVDLEEMAKFLNQMTLIVENNGKEIFRGPAGKLDGLENPVLLGTFDHGDAATLTVVLEVPGEEFDNEYADRIGEIDWQFSVEKLNYSHETDDKDDETYKVTVKKVWKDGNSASRPESIKVRLTRNGKTYDTVTLSADNNWRYTWRDLTKASGWEVEEVNVPKGYKVSYDSVGRVFTITNTGNLEQTGQLNWPIPLLAGIGLALIAGGATLLRKGRKNNA